MAHSCEFDFMEYIDESGIDMNLICSICHKPLKDPVSTPCDHTFGRDCITHWLTQSVRYSCPTCVKQPLLVKDLTPVSRLLRNILDQLRVRCTLCDQTDIPRGDFPDHIKKICPNAKVSCQAADIKCPWQGSRSELDDHISTCMFEPLRPVLATLIADNQQLADKVRQHDEQIEILTAKISQLNNAPKEDPEDDHTSVISSVNQRPQQEEYAIFVRNLPSGVQINAVFDLFAKIGPIKFHTKSQKPEINIFPNLIDKTSFCNAKVTYVNKESVTAAITEYNHKQIPLWNTRILVHQFIRDRKPRLHKGGLRANVASCGQTEAAAVPVLMSIATERPPSSTGPNPSSVVRRYRGPNRKAGDQDDKPKN